jgi:ABC-2 type transport system permease protein
LSGARIRDLSFALFFAVYALATVSAYDGAYPTVAERLSFAQSFGDNAAIRLFYGIPYDLITDGGYAAWRVGGLLSIFAAAWGVLSAVKLMRTEEDTGRHELVLAAPVGRGTALLGALGASAVGGAILGVALWASLAVAGLEAGESALMALGIAAVAVAFVGVGALASQLAATRRLAIELGISVLALSFLLRVVADTAGGAEWLHWLTPLGWWEELHAFSGSQPAVLLLPAGLAVVLLLIAWRIALERDIGEGVIESSDTREPRLELLSSPLAQALRDERLSLIVWLLGTALFAVVIGVISTSISSANISQNLQEQLSKVAGGASIITPSGYLSFSFLFFVLVVSLFGCAQIAAAWHEESEERLETLLSQPVSRIRWLADRLLLAVGGAVAVALAAGVFAWAGATAAGGDVSFAELLGAGANCLPVALLFLCVGALAYALVPRAATGLAYGLVLLAFVWQLFGSLVDLPAWSLDLSPFHHVGLVPAEDFKATAAIVMLAAAVVFYVAALRIFARRDLVGA